MDGAAAILAGQRPVNDLSVPLAEAGLNFPPQAGSLFISVTDLGTGTRTNHEIVINPAVQSLQDLAVAIAGAFDLGCKVDGLRRVALEVQIQHDHGLREKA